MAKLYDEDENAFEDEMKVFDMDAVSDNENEMDEAKVNKRTEKTDEKMSKKKAKGSGKASVLSGNKINRLVSVLLDNMFVEIFDRKPGIVCNQ